MVTLTFIFWMYVVVFSVIGTMRGWAKELLVSFAVILSLALSRLIERYLPVVNTLGVDSVALFWIRTIILLVLVFFGYQTIALPRLAGKAAREHLQDALLGIFLGAINGYLVVGTLWFYLHQANYPFEYIVPPIQGTPMGDAALEMIQAMPPRLLGEPGIYFAVILSFIFVMVVFI